MVRHYHQDLKRAWFCGRATDAVRKLDLQRLLPGQRNLRFEETVGEDGLSR
jgi:hypothetical protein